MMHLNLLTGDPKYIDVFAAMPTVINLKKKGKTMLRYDGYVDVQKNANAAVYASFFRHEEGYTLCLLTK